MPPEELWLQYSVVGILILAAGIIAASFYRLWKELLAWIEKQDQKREIERDKQREWQTEQDRIRDQRWQEFLTSMQEEWLKQDGKNSEVLKQLSAKIDLLIIAVNNHDVWARAKDQK